MNSFEDDIEVVMEDVIGKEEEEDEEEEEEEDEDEDEEEDDHKVRCLIEQGDMGWRPGEPFPTNLGNSLRAKIWRAAVGRNKEEAEEALDELAEKAIMEMKKLYPYMYPVKIRRKSKSYHDYVPCDHDMTKEEFYKLYRAISYANWVGAIMNAHVTISWQLLGYESHDKAAEALSSGFIKHLKLWYEDNKKRIGLENAPKLYWVYVHENGDVYGFHTHFITSIPQVMMESFRNWVRQRIKSLALGGREEGIKEAVKMDTRPSNPLNRQWRRFRYICKSVQPDIEIMAFIGPNPTIKLADLVDYEYESPGEIKCRVRVGLSRNFSKEIDKCGFKSLLDKGIIDVRRLYSDEKSESCQTMIEFREETERKEWEKWKKNKKKSMESMERMEWRHRILLKRFGGCGGVFVGMGFNFKLMWEACLELEEVEELEELERWDEWVEEEARIREIVFALRSINFDDRFSNEFEEWKAEWEAEWEVLINQARWEKWLNHGGRWIYNDSRGYKFVDITYIN